MLILRKINIIKFGIGKFFLTQKNSISCNAFVLIIRVNVDPRKVVFTCTNLMGWTAFALQTIKHPSNDLIIVQNSKIPIEFI